MQKGKRLSSQGGTASASKGGMSKKSAKTSAVVQGIRADQYAKEKLGIRTTVAGPVTGASTSPTGFISTKVSNQMYGTEYQKARNEYLASQGLGTMQKNGSFITGVQTDEGLKFTSQAREAYEASKREPIPLSRQMYESQQNFKLGLGALATAATGMTAFFTTAYYSNKTNPYSTYVQNFYKTANRTSTSIAANRGSKDSAAPSTAESTSVTDSTAVAQRDKRSYRGASTGETGTLSGTRTFLTKADKTIRGSMVG